MNREEEIEERASKFADDYGYFNIDLDDVAYGFIKGAEWSDEHPSFSFIVKVWNLATKTAIAQLNGEMPYFKSEKEIQELIKKKLKL